jgi:His/Glu/Gln/Arg/opine family amino acid ABC transporter permease subunit
MAYTWDFSSLWGLRGVFLRGAGMTAMLTIAATCIGVAIGLLLAMMRGGGIAALRWLATAYIELFRTTPSLVQLVWIY